jgi:fluoride exporter
VTLLLVVVGGALGAPLRYLTDLLVQSRHDSVFPWGTLTVNAVGSAVLGLTAGALAGGPSPGWVLPLVGTGLCGALTTFSTFGYETVRLAQEGSLLEATLNVLASVVVTVLACAGAYALALAVVG